MLRADSAHAPESRYMAIQWVDSCDTWSATGLNAMHHKLNYRKIARRAM